LGADRRPKNRRLRNLRLRFIVQLDQKTGREKAVLRRSIAALERKIRSQAENRHHDNDTRDDAVNRR
jgi:hypothetical protein